MPRIGQPEYIAARGSTANTTPFVISGAVGLQQGAPARLHTLTTTSSLGTTTTSFPLPRVGAGQERCPSSPGHDCAGTESRSRQPSAWRDQYADGYWYSEIADHGLPG